MIRPLVLFHASDLHFGYEDPAALAWFVAEVERERPALVLCTGDLTMRGTPREFAQARAWLSSLSVPIMLQPGNHDVPYYWYPLARAFHPWREYRALAAAVEHDQTLSGLAVVPLPTVAVAQWRLNWSKGRIREPDLATALMNLHTHRECPLRLVICHHPLVDADGVSSRSTRGGQRALAALAEAGADAVLSGHVHQTFDRTVRIDTARPIRLIGASTLSRRLRHSPPGYNRLEWTAQTGLNVFSIQMEPKKPYRYLFNNDL